MRVSRTNENLADTDGDGIIDGLHDTDGDGVDNAYELAYSRFLQTLANGSLAVTTVVEDADNDGQHYGKDPDSNNDGIIDSVSDQDKDGLPDALELASSSDPNSANSPVSNGNTPKLSGTARGTVTMNSILTESQYSYLINTYKIPRSLVTDVSDYDKDGYSDVWEIQHGTSPVQPFASDRDNDGDGITDLREAQLGLNPTKNDQPVLWFDLRQDGLDGVNRFIKDFVNASVQAVIGGRQQFVKVEWTAASIPLAPMGQVCRGQSNHTKCQRIIIKNTSGSITSNFLSFTVKARRKISSGQYTKYSELKITIPMIARESVVNSIKDFNNDGKIGSDSSVYSNNNSTLDKATWVGVSGYKQIRYGDLARFASGLSVEEANLISFYGRGIDGDVKYVEIPFDLKATKLEQVGESVDVIYQLSNKIIDRNLVLRVFRDSSGWGDYNSNQVDSVRTGILDAQGNCAIVGYQLNLQLNKECLRVRIQDGGANDTDGLVNGNVRVMMGLVLLDTKFQLVLGLGGNSGTSTGCSLSSVDQQGSIDSSLLPCYCYQVLYLLNGL